MMCPNCKRRLRADAEVCLCGWTSKPRENMQRWLTEGEQEKLSSHTRRAEEGCLERGLDTTEKKIAYCRRVRAMLSRPRTVADMRQWMDAPKSELARKMADEVRAARRMPVREAGEDWEEAA